MEVHPHPGQLMPGTTPHTGLLPRSPRGQRPSVGGADTRCLPVREGSPARTPTSERKHPVAKWFEITLVIEVGIIALAYLVNLFRAH